MRCLRSAEVDDPELVLAAKPGDSDRKALSEVVEEFVDTDRGRETGDYRFAFAGTAAEHRGVPGVFEATFDPEDRWRLGRFQDWSNTTLPGDGACTTRVDGEPPGVVKPYQTNGDSYGDDVRGSFEDVEPETGRS